MIPTPTQLASMMGGSTAQQASPRMATVTRVVNSRPYIRFDGEANESPTRYPISTGLTFSAGNRVLLLPAGGTYIIIARITP